MVLYEFFKAKPITTDLKLILTEIDCTLLDTQNIQSLPDIKSVSTLQNAKAGDVTFLSNVKYTPQLESTKASYCIVSKSLVDKLNSNTIPLISKNPYSSFSKLVKILYGKDEYYSSNANPYISPTASIHKTVKLGQNVKIYNGVTIEENAEIGDNTIIMQNTFVGRNVQIKENVTIYDSCTIMYCTINDGTIIRSGARVGNIGFGFVPNFQTGVHDINSHIGGVVLGRYVDIGCNTTIDRGYLSDTIIGDYTKIDNLVQIGHGVEIGKSCFIAAQAGIAGSAKLGDFILCGGQVGIAGHLNIASYTTIVAQSGVASDVTKPSTSIAGSPALDSMIWHRMNIYLKKLIKKS